MYDWEIIRHVEKQIANGFPNTYKRKYSLTGDGIYNLVQLRDLIYEFKVVKNSKPVSSSNDKLTTDAIKNKIIRHICSQVEHCNPQINDGKVYLNSNDLSLRVEVIKKLKMPN